jgi:hypothetical protein
MRFGDIVEIGVLVLLLVLPAIALIGAWCLDHRLRDRSASPVRRLFSLAAYCGAVLVAVIGLLAMVLLVPHDFTDHISLLNLSYAAVVSAGYFCCATVCALLLLSVSGLVVRYRVR